jgi:hypothetical protein
MVVLMTSCQNGSVDHVGASRLVILQQIPMVEQQFDGNFRAVLDMLYPLQCHDTAFIQDQVFLERIDLTTPYRREFIIPPKLWRDFFGSNNPEKKKSLREDLFYLSDSSFEKNPDRLFLADRKDGTFDQEKILGEYLWRNRNNSMVYLVSSDTVCNSFGTGPARREVHHDLARLNCRIVEDLKKKTREELMNTTVILVLIPPRTEDSVLHKQAPKAGMSRTPGNKTSGKSPACPPDSVVTKTNKQNLSIISEFRNLLHYIATTRDDELKRKYREDAEWQIRRIPEVSIAGINGSLNAFLNSGFSQQVKVSATHNGCGVISGIKIDE